ncbi:MAG: UDP-N-acetylmuramoyl-L-alanyl-D-glutamate--2,6-diaminopimelate ligase [Bacteroidales bacterium]|nr:UDP-N-acetylmuramoyl-L-alanyl-D-glutamate--2,6-diaminopimelate ligase [Bacteroidales bacterium]
MVKTLSQIVKNVEVLKIYGNSKITINQVVFDSRKIAGGDLFVAVKGTQTDGHEYINQVIEKKAGCIVCEKIPDELTESVTYITVKNSAKALGVIASNYYDNPSERLKLIGVTGTNGKTTIATLLYNVFQKLGYKTGLFSTVQNYIDQLPVEATHTTPDPLQLNEVLNKMISAGCEYAFMEVSSHALAQYRVSGLHFSGGIFTNITHDHLDYHKTFDEYLKAKKLFFDFLPKNAFALVNIDDKNGRVMVQNCKSHLHTYALKSVSDFKARVLESHFDGMLLSIDNIEVWSNLIGDFNAYNILAVYAAALLLQQDKDEILKIISSLETVNGRFEYVRSNTGITAIVDYAHTPDALKNVLNTISKIRTGNEQLITVVGAGGNRDKTKRPVMARVAIENSDKVILTSDNPRNEDPETIVQDMKAGIDPSRSRNVLIITDRREAIKTACLLAKTGDIILIAGKGHETYQEIKGVKYHFSDKEMVTEQFMLNKLNLQ